MSECRGNDRELDIICEHLAGKSMPQRMHTLGDFSGNSDSGLPDSFGQNGIQSAGILTEWPYRNCTGEKYLRMLGMGPAIL
jgi:hypothetical protein